jgi:hypothetical protein
MLGCDVFWDRFKRLPDDIESDVGALKKIVAAFGNFNVSDDIICEVYAVWMIH